MNRAHDEVPESEREEHIRAQDKGVPELKTEGEDMNMVAILPQDFKPPPKKTEYWYDYEEADAMMHQYRGYYIVYYR